QRPAPQRLDLGDYFGMAEPHLGARLPQEPFRASPLFEYQPGSRLGPPPGRRLVGISQALGPARIAVAPRRVRPRLDLLSQAGAKALVEGRGCKPRLPGRSLRLLCGRHRNFRLVRRASSSADVLVRSVFHLDDNDLPRSQHRRTFRHRGPRQRICTDQVHPRVRTRAHLSRAEERELSHRASLLPERSVLSFAATPSPPDVEAGVQGFRSPDEQLSRCAPRMRSQLAFHGAAHQAGPPLASEPRSSLMESEANASWRRSGGGPESPPPLRRY